MHVRRSSFARIVPKRGVCGLGGGRGHRPRNDLLHRGGANERASKVRALRPGEASIPSVIHFPKRAAIGRGGPPIPRIAVVGVKGVVGRPGDAPAVRLLDQTAAFRIETQGKAEVFGDGALRGVLRHLRERAGLRFGNRISKTVLSVPVMASAAVREAMVRCGKMPASRWSGSPRSLARAGWGEDGDGRRLFRPGGTLHATLCPARRPAAARARGRG